MIPKTRIVIVGTGLVVVTAAAVATWSIWSRSTSPSASQPQTTTAGTATAPAAASQGPRAAPVAPSPVAELVLQVNGATSTRIPAGTSVLFTVSLTGSASGTALRVGAAGRPWFADLRFETGDAATPLPWRIDRLGRPVTIWFEAESQTGSPTGPTPSDEAIVDGSSVHRIAFGVRPDEATRVASGTFSVRVVLPLPQNASGEMQVVSNSIAIVVEDAGSGAAASQAAETSRLEAAARFHLRSEQWEDAHGIALQLVKRDTAGALAYVLLGDALNGLRRDDEALAAYREALAELPGTVDESPDYLITRMTEVEARLSIAKRGGGRQ